jgi:hypothetical protein
MSSLGDALSSQTLSEVKRLKELSSDGNVSSLVSIQSKLSSEIGSASSSVGSASYSGWNDDVASKLSSLSDQLKGDIYPKISSDVGGGSLAMLITQVRLLNSKCGEYERVYSQRESISTSSSLSEEKLAANKRKKENLAGTLREIVSEINSILTNIKNIKFLGDNAGMNTDFGEHDTSGDLPDDGDDSSSGKGKKYYDFGFAGVYSENPYILGYQYGEYDTEEQALENRNAGSDENTQTATYDEAEYQRAIDEHRDIIMDDGTELEFSEGYLFGLIGRDYYNSNSCITLWAYDASTGKYRRVKYQDADGTNHFDPNDKGRTPAEMKQAKYK